MHRFSALVILVCLLHVNGLQAASFQVCERRINGMYLVAFHRRADTVGLFYHVEQCMVDKGFEAMLNEDFLQHPEHRAMLCRQRARDLLLHGLGKTDAAEEDQLDFRCHVGDSLQRQLHQLVQGGEFKRVQERPYTLLWKDELGLRCQRQVIGLFLVLLHRQPYPYEVRYFTRRCQIEKQSFNALFEEFASSREYKVATCERKIFDLFKQLLHRAPSQDEELYPMLHSCTEGRPFTREIMKMIDSKEFKRHPNGRR